MLRAAGSRPGSGMGSTGPSRAGTDYKRSLLLFCGGVTAEAMRCLSQVQKISVGLG